MGGSSKRYSAREVDTNQARREAMFLAAQAGVLLQVPATWFGEAWAVKTYGDKHEEVFFFGVIEKFHVQVQKFTCRFEGDSEGYPATWDDLSSYIVRSSMSYNSPKKSMQVSVNSDVNDCTPCNVVLNQGGGGCEVLNLSVYDAHDALNWDGQGSIPHVDNEGSPTLDEAIPPARGRGRPPKSRKRGRPKGSSMHTSTNPSPEIIRNIGRSRKQRRKSHAGDRPGTSANPYEEASDDDDNDEHALEGEGVECGDDDALEADGPVLDDSPEADCEFVDVVPPKWRSGDKMEQEPLGTFWPVLAFNGLVGPDLGHVPREFFEFHLFLMLFPFDLIDHIINETNMYANLQRDRCSSLHESMRRWVPLERHSFLRFLGMALGMALNYMHSKQHYWKDDMRGSLHFPNFGDKMSHTSFQQIKRFLHLRDNAKRPSRGCREPKLWQTLELEERLNFTFQKFYNLRQYVTVDERIIPSKCKLNPCRVYNPKKPHKFGIQVWNLCDSSTGYNYAFQGYDKMPCPELSFQVVANLVISLPRQGHHVFFDRYFTSVKLLEHLQSEGQGGTCTYVCNRKYFPGKEILNLGKQAHGTSRFAYCRKQGVIAYSWMDKKEIFFASNYFGMHKGEVTRMVADGNKMLVSCPDLAIKYNECKARWDVFDSMVLGHGYSLQTTMHGWKWWHALFWGLMDSVFTNAWIIWKDLYGNVDTSRFDFMLHLHEQLVQKACG
ncbi:hypothetical protein L7F22_001598 [Adiantum nelumboides]|nr:hypothetical protein [Adiantum nelumboides]